MANESSVLVRLRLLGGQRFAGEATAAGRGLGSIGQQGTRVSTKLNGVNRALGVTGKLMRGVGIGAAVAVGGGLAYGVKQGVNFEQQMANVDARLLTTRGNMNKLNEMALKLGAETQFSAGQAAGGMDQLAAAGFTTNEIMKTLPGTLSLAAASGTDLAASAELQGAVIRGFGLEAGKAGHVADVLAATVNKSALEMSDLAEGLPYVASTARQTGTSFEQVAAAAGILGNAGIKGSMMGTALRTSMLRLTDPTKKMETRFKSMGIEASSLAAMPLADVIGRVAEGLKKLPTRGEKVGAISAIFGKEAAPSMLNLMSKGSTAIKKMTRDLENNSGAAKRSEDIMRNTVRGGWDNFTGSIETASIKLTRRFNPALKSALDSAAKFVNVGSTALSGFGSGLGAAAKKPVGTGDRMGPAAPSGAEKAGAAVRGALAPAVQWAQANLPKLGAAALGAGRSLLEAFRPAMPFIQNVVLPLLKGLAIGVIGGIVTAFKVAVIVIRVVSTALGWIGTALAPLKPLFQGIGLVIGFFATGAILKLLGGLKYLGGAFKLLALPVRFATGALSFVGRAVGKLFGAFSRALTGVQRFVGTFTSMPARVVRAALNVVGGVVNTIQRLPGRIAGLARRTGGDLIRGLIAGARSLLGSLAGFMGRVGGGIVSGIVNAIKGAPNTILQTLLSLVPDALRGTVGKLLGKVPGLATGGVVSQGGMAVVGERGPELLNLPTGSSVYDNRTSRRASAAMAAPAPVYVIANLHLSGRQIHSEVFRVDRQMSEAT